MNSKKTVTFITIAVLLAGTVYINFVHGTVPVRMEKAFLFFPFEINGWKDKEKLNSDYMAAALGADDMLLREYEDSSGQKFELYFSYFEYTKEKKTPHAPQLCWVGSGWVFNDLGQERMPISGCPGCPVPLVKKILAQKDGQSVLLFYCYRTNRAYTADLLEFKMISARDAFFRRRNNAFAMQLSVPLDGGEPALKEAQALEFLKRVFYVLESDFLG